MTSTFQEKNFLTAEAALKTTIRGSKKTYNGCQKHEWTRIQKKNNKRYTNKNTQNNWEPKPCNQCGRPFVEGHLKNCTAMVTSSIKCRKSHLLAKVCRLRQY